MEIDDNSYSKKKVIFIDRDGTLIVEKHYLSDPEKVVLCDGAVEGLLRFKKAGFRFVVVTNQSGIGRGYFSEADMHSVHERIDELLLKHDITIDQYLFCPHKPDDKCSCRKPNTGMLQTLKDVDDIDLCCSFMIGDKSCDIEFARNANIKSLLVKTGYGLGYDFQLNQKPDLVADSILEASRLIV